jgi:5-methylcytosine-specific restriction endonuclease McrA
MCAKARRWREKNIEKRLQVEAKYRAANRDRRNADSRAYQKANRDEIQLKRLVKRLSDPTYATILSARTCERAARRKAIQIGSQVGDHKKVLDFYLKVKLADRCTCKYCGRECGTKLPLSVHVDHKISLRNKGAHDVPNLIACCRECNIMKGHKTPEEFRRYLAVLRKAAEIVTKSSRPEDVKKI